MNVLDEKELSKFSTFFDREIGTADAIGLKIEIGDDLRDWKRLMHKVGADYGAAQTLDPSLNWLNPENSFWLFTNDRFGNPVSCHANRIIETSDFVRQWLINHRLFGNRPKLPNYYKLDVQEDLPLFRGRMNWGGGGWVHPDWRGKNIAGLMSRMCRAFAVQHFDVDYYIGFIEASMKRRSYGEHRQGLSNRQFALSGRYPGRPTKYGLDLYWMHRDEIIEQVYQALESETPDMEELMTLTTYSTHTTSPVSSATGSISRT